MWLLLLPPSLSLPLIGMISMVPLATLMTGASRESMRSSRSPRHSKLTWFRPLKSLVPCSLQAMQVFISLLYPLLLQTPHRCNLLYDTPLPPHHYWIQNYCPLIIPICFLDKSVIYFASVGTVMFNLVIRSKRAQSMEFSNVLHIPNIGYNLLSMLYLT